MITFSRSVHFIIPKQNDTFWERSFKKLYKNYVSSISLLDLDDYYKTKKIFDYSLVSPEEADFQAGKISVTSPVGQGLLGFKIGDKIKVKAPAGLMEFEILSIK